MKSTKLIILMSLLFSQLGAQNFYSFHGVTDSTVYFKTITEAGQEDGYVMNLQPWGSPLTIDQAKEYTIKKALAKKESESEVYADVIKRIIEGDRIVKLLSENLSVDYYVETYERYADNFVGSYTLKVDGQEVPAESMKNSDKKIVFNATLENFVARIESETSFTVMASHLLGKYVTFYLVQEDETKQVYRELSGRMVFEKKK